MGNSAEDHKGNPAESHRGNTPQNHTCSLHANGQQCQCARQGDQQWTLDAANLALDSPPPYEVAILDQTGLGPFDQPQVPSGAKSEKNDKQKPSPATGSLDDESGEPSWQYETPELPPRLRDATDILSKPIALPTVRSAQGSPYVRAYPVELARLGITRETFLGFVDSLNRVVAENPPLVAVGAVGGVVSLVPEPTTALAGTVIELAATASNVALAEGRTELLLRRANCDLFHPVGLQARVAKLEAVARIAGMPFLDAKTGKLTSGLRVLAPLDEERDLHTLSAQRRRLRDLDEWLSPLDLEELPELAKPSSAMGKMHMKMSEFQRKEEEKELMKSRKKALEKYTEAKRRAQERYDKDMQELDRKVDKLGRKTSHDNDEGTSQERDSATEELRGETGARQVKQKENTTPVPGECSESSSKQTVQLDKRASTGEDGVSSKKEGKKEAKEGKKLEKQQKKAEKEGQRAESKQRKEMEKENRKREEKEKETKRAEKKAQKASTRVEEKRAAIREEYEKELEKRSEEYQKSDKEQRGIKKINWLIITERSKMEEMLATRTILKELGLDKGKA